MPPSCRCHAQSRHCRLPFNHRLFRGYSRLRQRAVAAAYARHGHHAMPMTLRPRVYARPGPMPPGMALPRDTIQYEKPETGAAFEYFPSLPVPRQHQEEAYFPPKSILTTRLHVHFSFRLLPAAAVVDRSRPPAAPMLSD